MTDISGVIETFKEEARELLEEMERILLELEDEPDNKDHLNTLFRAMHTVKGSAGLFAFNHIVSFTHEVETLLDKVRNNEVSINQDLLSLFLACKDHTEKLLEETLDEPAQKLDAILEENNATLIKSVRKYFDNKEIDYLNVVDDTVETLERNNSTYDKWVISLLFKEDALRMGIDPLSFMRYMQTLGDIDSSYLLTSKIPTDESYHPEACYVNLKLTLKSEADKQTIENVFEFATDDCDITILPPDSKIAEYIKLLEEMPVNEVKRLGDMLISIGAITENDLNKALSLQSDVSLNQKQHLGEILGDTMIQSQVIESAIHKQAETKQKLVTESTSIRVDSRKLGDLINLVGELVISGAAMNLLVEKHALPEVNDTAMNINSLISDVRDIALELRMVPINETFSKFKRVVRDMSKELGKDIELIITGGDTELDKTVVEKINDPLTHLVRNSLDHGIEMPETRISNKKPAQGTINLNAYHDAGQIIIEVSDDGGGLNAERILAKAISKGIVDADAKLSKAEIFNLIFEAGLSTKQTASDLSGRGVGMDVVKRNIEALRGTIKIDSFEGEGTTISITLPLTLSIIDGFLVEASGEQYIIPLATVEQCVELEDDISDKGKDYINLRGQAMPFLRLNEFFHSEHLKQKENSSQRKSIVIVRSGNNRAGIAVDFLHGEHQTVIKPLGEIFNKISGLTGSTVLGNGSVALILDTQALIDKAIQKGKYIK